jgi:phosphoglycerate dehydrogenase-like enzyme
MKEADYLVVDLIALGPARHFLSTQLLAQCKKGCTLINVGDADAIDECALLEALNNNKQFAAVSLDLAKAQPRDREPRNLRQHPLVRVAPLPGSMTYDALDAYYREFDCDLFGDTHVSPRFAHMRTARICIQATATYFKFHAVFFHTTAHND